MQFYAKGFDFNPLTHVISGVGCLERLPECVRAVGGSRVLLVSDAGIVAAGHVARAQKLLDDAGITHWLFDNVHENPTTEDVERCVAVARSAEIDVLVGLGGGSSLDTAKGCNFIYTNGGEMKDYWGHGKASKPMLPLIAVPTTAGTGSECQSYALISDAQTHQKMACGDAKNAARFALLDPELTLTQPRQVTIDTALDALVHAVECAVTTRRTPMSLLYAREAFRLLNQHFEQVLATPEDLEARAAMQLGAAYAGMAIENSMLGAAHGMANPLTAKFDVVHGRAVGVMLPHVVQFNAQDEIAAQLYLELAIHAGLVGPTASPEQAATRLAERLQAILRVAEMPLSIGEWGITLEAIDDLAEMATKQWTAQFNPRPVHKADFVLLYQQALAQTANTA